MWSRLLVSVAVVLGVCAVTCTGQQLFFGGCPSQQVVQNFATSQYLGTWYENQKYFTIFELGGKCITATYSDKGNGRIGVVNEQVNILTNKRSTATGEAVLVNSASGEAKLQVTFDNNIFGTLGSSSNGNYWVLDTDYTSYAIVWSCTDLAFFNTQLLWILTREQNPDASVITTARNLISGRNLDVSRLENTIQTNCP